MTFVDDETTIGAESLPHFLKIQKKSYLEARKASGGTAEGYRRWVYAKTSPESLEKWKAAALMEAATRTWQAPPRKAGPDLFSINGLNIPEFLTRPSSAFVTGEEIEDGQDEWFEKVDHKYATVGDLGEHVTIHLRKAAQASAAAERLATAFDEARRRAGGRLDVLLRTVGDP